MEIVELKGLPRDDLVTHAALPEQMTTTTTNSSDNSKIKRIDFDRDQPGEQEQASFSDADEGGPYEDVPISPPKRTSQGKGFFSAVFSDQKDPEADDVDTDAQGQPPAKRQKTEPTTDPEKERETILHRLERLITRGTIQRQDLNVLEECKDMIKFLKDIQSMPTIELKVLIAILKRKIQSDQYVGDPVKLIQRSLARAGGVIRRDQKVEERIEKDTVMSLALDDLLGDYVEGLPALVRVGAAFATDLVDFTMLPPIAPPPNPVATLSSSSTGNVAAVQTIQFKPIEKVQTTTTTTTTTNSTAGTKAGGVVATAASGNSPTPAGLPSTNSGTK